MKYPEAIVRMVDYLHRMARYVWVRPLPDFKEVEGIPDSRLSRCSFLKATRVRFQTKKAL